MKSTLLKSAVLALLALSFSLGAFGQAISANLVGSVYDSSGAVVQNADVEALNVATGVKTTTKATGAGQYRFNNLPIGTYTVTVKSPGFGTSSQQAFLALNQTGTLNFTIAPGGQSVTVEVSGTPPLIDTTTAQIQSNYEEKALHDLPTASVGLGVLNLSLLGAGVASTGGLGAGSGPSISGQRPRNNNFTIEGVDNNNKGVTGPLNYIPNDAVQSFALLQNQFSPEFGHSNGGQFNTVVVSGTNQFHGRAYEYFQNRNLNALDTSLRNQGTLKVPRFDNNRFGGQFGGPIFKNKLFFFANYEYNPIGQAASPGSPLFVPTANGYTQLAGIPGVSASNIAGLKKYATGGTPDPAQALNVCDYVTATSTTPNPLCPNAPDTTHQGIATLVEFGVFPLTAPNYNNTTALVTSMDFDLSEKDQIRGRYIYNKNILLDTGLTGTTLPAFFTTQPNKFHTVALSEYHTFSPTVTNEFRLGFNRFAQIFVVPGVKFQNLDAFPNFTFDDLGGFNLGPDPNAPQFAIQNLYQGADNLTWTKGNHTLKFGTEYRKYISPQQFIQRSRADYDYANFDTFANDRLPDGGLAERSFGNVGYSGDQYGAYWFVNDIWKVRPNLSLNLGLRYEYTSTPAGWKQQSLNSIASVPGLISFDSPRAPKKDFMPRLGFAYSPGTSGATSIRGGFGMGYDVLYDNIGVLSRPPQIGSTIDCPDPVCNAGAFLANGGIPPQPQISGITVLDQATARANTSSYLPANVKYPYALSWNLGVQHVFLKDYTAEVRYVGTHGVHLNVQNRINIVPVVNAQNGLPTYTVAPTQAQLDGLTNTLANLRSLFNASGFINPSYLNNGFTGPIVGFLPFGDSIYHGLQTQLNRRFSNGLQFQAAYTYSHNIDNSTADFFSTIVAPRRPQDFQNLKSERSNSVLDHRHRFTISAIYEVPWFKNGNWFKKNVLGNYEFAPIYTWESGQWGTVQSGRDVNLNADGAGDRVVFNPKGIKGTGSDVTALFNTSGDVVAYLANVSTAQYIRGAAGAITNSSRNTLQLAPINNWDISLSKHLSITERMKLDFYFQLLNVLNHPQFITGSVNQVTSISVTSTGQKNFFVPGKPNFNNLEQSWASNARTTSLGLKFIF